MESELHEFRNKPVIVVIADRPNSQDSAFGGDLRHARYGRSPGVEYFLVTTERTGYLDYIVQDDQDHKIVLNYWPQVKTQEDISIFVRMINKDHSFECMDLPSTTGMPTITTTTTTIITTIKTNTTTTPTTTTKTTTTTTAPTTTTTTKPTTTTAAATTTTTKRQCPDFIGDPRKKLSNFDFYVLYKDSSAESVFLAEECFRNEQGFKTKSVSSYVDVDQERAQYACTKSRDRQSLFFRQNM